MKPTTDYLHQVFTPIDYQELIKDSLECAGKLYQKKKFQAIAFSGMSGAALAFPLGYLMDLPLLCVRKNSSHSFYTVEGMLEISSYIIVDDFIDSGFTLDYILKSIRQEQAKKNLPLAECKGIILYKNYNRYVRFKSAQAPLTGIEIFSAGYKPDKNKGSFETFYR